MSGVRLIIIANVICYFLAGSDAAREVFGLWPLQSHFLPWQIVTYSFLHANFTHILFNMWGVWMFGRDLEALVGRRGFLQLYFASVIAAAATQLMVTSLSGDVFPTVGASGGVFGLLLAYAMFYPNRRIILLLPPIPMPVWLFAILYALLELTLGVTGTEISVAHFAHLGGMLGAFVMIKQWAKRRR